MPINEMLMYVWLRFNNGIRMSKAYVDRTSPYSNINKDTMFVFNWNSNRFVGDFYLDWGKKDRFEILVVQEDDLKKKLKEVGMYKLANELQVLCMFESETISLGKEEIEILLEDRLGASYRYGKIWSRVLQLAASILGCVITVYLIIAPLSWVTPLAPLISVFSFLTFGKVLARIIVNREFGLKWFT